MKRTFEVTSMRSWSLRSGIGGHHCPPSPTARSLIRGEEGIALAFMLVALPAFVGLALLAIDISRGNNLHYDLQKAADALALAAAAELNGSPSAITRANAALAEVVANGARFADGGPTERFDFGGEANNVEVDYLCSIPADDDDPIDLRDCSVGGDRTTEPTLAQFAYVRISGANAQPITTLISASVLGRPRTVSLGAEAVAGFTAAVCDLAPIYICNPLEGNPNYPHLYSLLQGEEMGGRMITSRYSDSDPFKGNYGFVDFGSGASELAYGLAAKNPKGCAKVGQPIITEPGEMTKLNAALDTRFGINTGDWKQLVDSTDPTKDRSNWPPGVNVRTGYKSCSEPDKSRVGTTIEGFAQLGRDRCLSANNCAESAIVGDGVWDFNTYWAVNFPNLPRPNGWSNDGIMPTRYEVYRYEIEQNLTSLDSLGGENGEPIEGCTDPVVQPPTDTPDRRLLNGIIVDCEAQCADGHCSGSFTLNVNQFATFFITEALETGNNNINPSTTGPGDDNPDIDPNYDVLPDDVLRLELVDLLGPEGIGTLDDLSRNEAVLYR